MTNPSELDFIKLDTVIALTKLSRSSIYAMMGNYEFPRPYRVGKRAVSWLRHEVMQWCRNRVENNRVEYT